MGYSIDLYGHAQAELRRTAGRNFFHLKLDDDYMVPFKHSTGISIYVAQSENWEWYTLNSISSLE